MSTFQLALLTLANCEKLHRPQDRRNHVWLLTIDRIWFGTLTFGMALTIPDEEYDLCMKLARPGYAVLGLTNDLYSWRKEREDAERAGQDYVFNAIWVIMRERSVTEDEAKAICADEIRRYTLEYQQIIDATKNDAGLSKDTRAYLEAVMFSCIGNLVWSIYCPRYHAFRK